MARFRFLMMLALLAGVLLLAGCGAAGRLGRVAAGGADDVARAGARAAGAGADDAARAAAPAAGAAAGTADDAGRAATAADPPPAMPAAAAHAEEGSAGRLVLEGSSDLLQTALSNVDVEAWLEEAPEDAEVEVGEGAPPRVAEAFRTTAKSLGARAALAARELPGSPGVWGQWLRATEGPVLALWDPKESRVVTARPREKPPG